VPPNLVASPCQDLSDGLRGVEKDLPAAGGDAAALPAAHNSKDAWQMQSPRPVEGPMPGAERYV